MPTFPEWWNWDLSFTGHAELRMEQRGVTEVEVRAMLADRDPRNHRALGTVTMSTVFVAGSLQISRLSQKVQTLSTRRSRGGQILVGNANGADGWRGSLPLVQEMQLVVSHGTLHRCQTVVMMHQLGIVARN